MLKGLRRQRRGFTLIETVVTVGIVATMAAVVIPQVMKQFDTADPTRLQNDLKNLQTAIETFNVNVKALPGDLDDLVNAITDIDSSLTTVATGLPEFLDPAQTDLWNGPYVDFALLHINAPTANESEQSTAFGARILDTFVCYDSGDDTHGESYFAAGAAGTDQPACDGTPVGQLFLAIQIVGLADDPTDDNFLDLNTIIDGTNETAGDEDILGRVRFDNTEDIVYFLVVPLN